MNAATGWAVAARGRVLVATVSPTRRGALVNWLVTEAGLMVMANATDEQIEGAWISRRGAAGAEAVKVTIAPRDA